MIFKNQNETGLFKSIFTASFILLLHVVLLASIGVIIILFKGMYQYLPWVMVGFALLLIGIFLFVYKRVKENSSDIKDILSMPEFQDRTVDVKLLGGLASFRIMSEKDKQALIEHQASNLSEKQLMIESESNQIEQRILQLTELYKKKIITKKEFKKAKQDILKE